MKLFLKGLLIILSFIVIVVIAVIAQSVNPAQQRPDAEVHTFADTLAKRKYDLDSLRQIIGDNKGLPEGFEIAAAIAYSAYPELKDATIDMTLTPDGAPMEATIDISSLFVPWQNRRYRILLNNGQQTFFDPILLRALPFDAQVGILAHELGHVAYYDKLNILQFGKWGLMYLRSEEFRTTHERTTDLMPIYHGLGSQIYQYAHFVRYDSSCQAFYQAEKDFMDAYYMTDRELLEELNRYDTAY